MSDSEFQKLWTATVGTPGYIKTVWLALEQRMNSNTPWGVMEAARKLAEGSKMILFPPDYPNLNSFEPVIFLAGPIQGAEDWQTAATKMVRHRATTANPRRPEFHSGDFDSQVKWETYWLNRADAIVFWLAPEHEHLCERAYAQTTRFELGEWSLKAPHKISVGADPKFPGLRYLKTRFQHTMKIFDSLEKTVEHAVDRAMKK